MIPPACKQRDAAALPGVTISQHSHALVLLKSVGFADLQYARNWQQLAAHINIKPYVKGGTTRILHMSDLPIV